MLRGNSRIPYPDQEFPFFVDMIGKGIDAKRTLLAFEKRRSGDAAACPRKRQNG